MSDVTGIRVRLRTAPRTDTGSDDHVYLGVCGTVGGREFALDVRGFDDWEPDSDVSYAFGPGFSTSGGAKEPQTAADQLERLTICLPNVTHVYLRKQGDRSSQGDDYWELSRCEAFIKSENDLRAFVSTGTGRLGNEYGHEMWLAEGDETGHGGGLVDARLSVEGDAECEVTVD
ncbi:MAG: hypothetical protein ACOC06_02645 [Halorubrum sp.]